MAFCEGIHVRSRFTIEKTSSLATRTMKCGNIRGFGPTKFKVSSARLIEGVTKRRDETLNL
jgi:hypothetical protein